MLKKQVKNILVIRDKNPTPEQQAENLGVVC
jgi:hypothetical protein